MSRDLGIEYSTAPRPELILPPGRFVTIGGEDYRATLWQDGSALVDVEPGQEPPGRGFEAQPSGGSRKHCRKRHLDRCFERDIAVHWKYCWWLVVTLTPDCSSLECRYLSGHTTGSDLSTDPRAEVRFAPEGPHRSEYWATLTLDDVDELVINEVEVVKGRRDDATGRRIYSWRRSEESAGFTEQEYRMFAELFAFWGERHAEIGATPSWAGIAPDPPHRYPADEITALGPGADGFILRREGRAVHEYWIERGTLNSRGEFGHFIDALKAMAASLASQYRHSKGYEYLSFKLKGIMPDGVEVVTIGGRDVYRLIDGDPQRYIPVYGTPGGLMPHLLTRSLSRLNAELLEP